MVRVEELLYFDVLFAKDRWAVPRALLCHLVDLLNRLEPKLMGSHAGVDAWFLLKNKENQTCRQRHDLVRGISEIKTTTLE